MLLLNTNYNKIDNLYFKKSKRIKSIKHKYFSYSIWRQVFLIKSNKIHLTSQKKFYNSATRIPSTYVNHEILIYNGRNFSAKDVNPYRIGMRAGSLVWFKKPAIIKKNSKKK